MKKLLILCVLISVTSSIGANRLNYQHLTKYDPKYVEITTTTYDKVLYYVVSMSRADNKIKAKYFAAPDYNGNTVPQRYTEWAKGRNIVGYCSGTYVAVVNGAYNLEGLTIDNGVIVNKTLSNKFDGLVIVYATGGIAVSNIDDADLTLQGGSAVANKKYNLRNSYDLELFKKWAEEQEATVFQTHLLVYRNKLAVYSNGDPNMRERRFLAAGKDLNGNIYHIIVHRPIGYETTLYSGAKDALEFLNDWKDLEIIYMINLDTGAQDVFRLYAADGSVYQNIKSQQDIDYAWNVLAYYFE